MKMTVDHVLVSALHARVRELEGLRQAEMDLRRLYEQRAERAEAERDALRSLIATALPFMSDDGDDGSTVIRAMQAALAGEKPRWTQEQIDAINADAEMMLAKARTPRMAE